MRISVIIPIFNEERYIEKIISKVSEVNIEKEIIIVNDGSTDNSLKIIKNLEFKNLKIISNSQNYGKGYSIRVALKHVNNEIIIIQDGDLEYDPNDYFKLIQPFKKDNVYVVYGSRFVGIKRFILKRGINYNFRAFVNLCLTSLFNIFYNQKITDVHTCYKVFDRRLISQLNLEEDGFSFCPEFSAKVSKLGYKIHEVLVSYNPRSKSEGKKITFLDGFYAIKAIIKYKIFN
jgi:glycosyltransferase involved in cell wall biosynthesis